MSSSVAFSNWTAISVSDINNPQVATSNYEIPNRFTMRLSYEHDWLPDFTTKFSIFGQAYQARAYSYNFLNGGLNDIWGDGQESLHLLYVPTGPTDPNVLFCGGAAQANPLCRVSATGAGATQYRSFDTAAFFKWADQVGLKRGAQTNRNDQDGTWTEKFDLKLEQQVPTGIGKASVYATIENFANLLNSHWGVPYESAFPQEVRTVEADRDPATNRFIYRQVSAVKPEAAVGSAAFWTVKFGINWNF